MKKYTTQQKKEFYAKIRSDFATAKKEAEKLEFRRAYEHAQAQGLTMSLYAFVFVKIQLEKLGLKGIPYIDCKTFAGWKKNGYTVKKGQKSKINGITFLRIEPKKEDKEKEKESKNGFLIPKAYKLFHISQVEKTA